MLGVDTVQISFDFFLTLISKQSYIVQDLFIYFL